MQPFKSISYATARPGPRLIVLGAVHGDEVCGTRAIERVVREIDDGTLRLVAGRLTLVPVTNVLAYAEHRREGDRNLNRKLAPTSTPRAHEDHVANWLCPLLAEHEVLLDLHSFRSPGVPFVFLGPTDNAGPVEPFAQAAREEAIALRLGVGRAVDGWLATYAAGSERRRTLAATMPEAKLDIDPAYGIGTTEYMRSVGGCAVTLECGQHDDPHAPEIAHRAIVRTLAHLGLIDAPDPAPARRHGIAPPLRSDRPDEPRRRVRPGVAQLRPGRRGRAHRHPCRWHAGGRAVRRRHRLPERRCRSGRGVVLPRPRERSAAPLTPSDGAAQRRRRRPLSAPPRGSLRRVPASRR